MWSFAAKAIAKITGLKTDLLKPRLAPNSECSDDETSLNNHREEGLECPICCESFNIVENVPYVLWCGHTLCKNCVLGLQQAVVKFPALPIHVPFFISCPWCNLLSFRLFYSGDLKFPSKNFFLLWMVENINVDRLKSRSSVREDHRPVWSSNRNLTTDNDVSHINQSQVPSVPRTEQVESNHGGEHFISSYLNIERLQLSLHNSLVFFLRLTVKFPLVVIFLLIVMYVIPASAAILVLYILITVLFALPSFLMLYLAYPCLDWLVREIIT